ncbi:MAG: hypothetical protein ACRCV7_06770 [Culicoidibacterales bacterium]
MNKEINARTLLFLGSWIILVSVAFLLHTPLVYIKFPIMIIGASVVLITTQLEFYYRYLLVLLLAFICTLLVKEVGEIYSIVGSLVVVFVGYKNDTSDKKIRK